jgi:hypothetical protein
MRYDVKTDTALLFNSPTDHASLYTAIGVRQAFQDRGNKIPLSDQHILTHQVWSFLVEAEIVLLKHCQWPFGHEDALNMIGRHFQEHILAVLSALHSPYSTRKGNLFIASEQMRLELEHELATIVHTDQDSLDILSEALNGCVSVHAQTILGFLGDSLSLDAHGLRSLSMFRVIH